MRNEYIRIKLKEWDKNKSEQWSEQINKNIKQNDDDFQINKREKREKIKKQTWKDKAIEFKIYTKLAV